MDHSGNIPIIDIFGTLFGNIHRNFTGNIILGIYHGNVQRIFHEYLPGVLWF